MTRLDAEDSRLLAQIVALAVTAGLGIIGLAAILGLAVRVFGLVAG